MMLHAEFMELPMNPFEFTSRMYRGAPAMIVAQQDELAYRIELTGREFADIVAFVHDADEQAKFTEADIPYEPNEMMEHTEEEGAHDQAEL